MILVTGGTGFLGRNMLPILKNEQQDIRVITRAPDHYPWLHDMAVDIIEGDVADVEVVRRAAEGVQYIIHAAGLFRFWGKTSDFEQTNIQGTENILKAALEAGVEKLVHVSTIAVAGFPRDPSVVIDESYPSQPFDDYQQTKVEGEHLVLKYCQEQNVPAVIIRGGAFYGPYGHYAFNKLFFEDPLAHHWPMGVDGGRHITFPAYTKDVARGILLALRKGRPGEIYNITGDWMAHRDVEKTIARISGTSAYRFHAPGAIMVPLARVLTFFGDMLGFEPHYVINMQPYIFGEWHTSYEKAARELGFQPTPFEEGVRETLQWYVDAGIWKPRKGPFTRKNKQI